MLKGNNICYFERVFRLSEKQYRSQTILDFIGVNPEDEVIMQLEGILSEVEIKRRHNEYTKKYQKEKYRNENNLTKTEQKRLEEFTKIAEMELQGMSYKKIAKELNYHSHRGITKKINKEYEKINYQEIKEKVSEILKHKAL